MFTANFSKLVQEANSQEDTQLPFDLRESESDWDSDSERMDELMEEQLRQLEFEEQYKCQRCEIEECEEHDCPECGRCLCDECLANQ